MLLKLKTALRRLYTEDTIPCWTEYLRETR